MAELPVILVVHMIRTFPLEEALDEGLANPDRSAGAAINTRSGSRPLAKLMRRWL